MAFQLGIVEVCRGVCDVGLHPIMAGLQIHEKWPMGHHTIDSGKRHVELDRCPGPREELVCGRVDGAGHNAEMAVPTAAAEIQDAGVDAHLIGIEVGSSPAMGRRCRRSSRRRSFSSLSGRWSPVTTRRLSIYPDPGSAAMPRTGPSTGGSWYRSPTMPP